MNFHISFYCGFPQNFLLHNMRGEIDMINKSQTTSARRDYDVELFSEIERKIVKEFLALLLLCTNARY